MRDVVTMSQENDDRRLLSTEECQRVFQRIADFMEDGGETRVEIIGWWNGELRWARNRVNLAGDRRNISVHVQRKVDHGQVGQAVTNQFDDISLRAVIRAAERVSRLKMDNWPQEMVVDPPLLPRPSTHIWNDTTYSVQVEQRAKLAQVLSEGAEFQNMLSAGYLETRACERASGSTVTMALLYEKLTQAQCSMTVRHPKGIGSGWAGKSSYDWTAINGPHLAEVALRKCMASLNPVRIEPGRYTVILEPQAVGDLLGPLITSLGRQRSEGPRPGPWRLGPDTSLDLWRSKLGLKVTDERVTIQHDPLDPQLGVVSREGLESVTWIEHGILTNLPHEKTRGPTERESYTLPELNDNIPVLARPGYRMEGGNSSIEEMVASTKRALLVTRFSNISVLDPGSVLLTGTTRDGLWLIENGKITKAVHNMRITESPIFVLNQLDELGPVEPIFHPVKNPGFFSLTPVIVPSLKARDFSFTSLIDAV